MQGFDDQNNLGQNETGAQQARPEEHPQSPGASGENARAGVPYSPSYPGNTYSPRRDEAPPPGERQDAGQPQNPYQYNANSGWQQSPRPQGKGDPYEWKFQDYDQMERRQSGKNKANRGLVVATISLIGALSIGLIALAVYSIYAAAPDGESPVVGEEQTTGEQPDDISNQLQITSNPVAESAEQPDGKLTIPQVAEAVLPSVVGVIQYSNNQYLEGSSYGSGIVMSEDGYIITNAHVVEGGTGFKIQFGNGDAYDAQLIGYDSMTDLAVLKIPATGLTPAKFGDSDSLRVGETVIAIGNSGGDVLAGSVTQGIVSAINREVQTTNYRMTYIQTDAAINPGNSGGALANEYGFIVGINSAKILATGYEGIGFAIPVTSAKVVIDDIIANGKVTGRVMLGVTCKRVDEETARRNGVQTGLSIDSISPESGLAEKGVLRGDIITHIDGTRVYSLTDVRNILDQRQAGDAVTLSFYRKIGTREEEFEVQTILLASQ